jgi:uncharacterized protein (TIGR03000 family)
MLKRIWSAATIALVGLTLVLTPAISEAQRHGGGGGGHGGGGRGGGGRFDGGKGRDFGRGGFRGGWGWGWGYPGYYGAYYGGYPYYDYPVYTEPQTYTTAPQYSYYPSTPPSQLTNPNDAGFIVRVPDPNAEIWFQDYRTQQRGTERHYESGALDPNLTYTFQVRARWTHNGQQMDQTRQVQARAGQNVTVDFTTPASEPIQTNPQIQQPLTSAGSQ